MSKKHKVFIIFFIFVTVLGVFFILRAKVSSKKLNVLLITMDALRPDYMGCYGYNKNTTPNIDNFAKNAVIFTQAISHSSHTAVANASLVTSTYPVTHRVEDWGYKINSTLPTLAGILKSYGYTTGFISDQLGFSWLEGFEEGFDFFRLMLSDKRVPSGKKIKIVDITNYAIKWLKKNRNRKFFLWVYYIDPHGAYTPSAPYDQMFILNNTINKTLPVCKDKYSQVGIGCIPQYIKSGTIANPAYYISQYCGEIRQTDERLAKLFKALKELGLSKNTIIIFTSDHGEGMGEHNQYFCHTIYLYDYLIHIPLIIKHPSQDIKKHYIKQQVRTIDIAPTILDFAGIKKPLSMQGESLKPLILGEKVNFPKFSFGKWLDKSYIRTEGWKLIYNASNENYELYNLKKDPQEVDNLVNREIKMFNFLKRILLKHMASVSSDEKVKRVNISEEDKRLLRSLGYAQ